MRPDGFCYMPKHVADYAEQYGAVRTWLFWVVMLRVVIIFSHVSGQHIGPIFSGQESMDLDS
jgi:hypothetical protein